MKALLLIDLQNDFMPGGSLAVPEADVCIEAANVAQKYFKAIIASKDWHPESHLSFAHHHEGKKPGDEITLNGQKQTLFPRHCVQNTFGAMLSKNLNQSQIQHVITKGQDPNIDSYSAFFDNARVHSTGLKNYLDHCFIDELFLLGVATEYCVKHSAIDARTLGLKTNVIIDACRGIGLNERHIPEACKEMLDHGVRLLHMHELVRELS